MALDVIAKWALDQKLVCISLKTGLIMLGLADRVNNTFDLIIEPNRYGINSKLDWFNQSWNS